VVWGIQGSGGSVPNVARVLERVVCRRRVWRRGIKPVFECWGVGARGRGSAIEIFERHTILVLVVRQYMMVTASTSHPRPGSLVAQSGPNHTRGPGDASHRILGGSPGLAGHPPSFSFFQFPLAESLEKLYLFVR
jgi:hypothetical protein